MIQYENIFKARGKLYVREYDSETKLSTTKAVKYIPKLYTLSKKESNFKAIDTGKYLLEESFKSKKDYEERKLAYTQANVRLYGNESEEQGYIRENYGEPVENDHQFRTLYLDIETAILDNTLGKEITKNDWKPTGPRAAMAVITSIQMYDSLTKKFIILGLNKDWNNEGNYKSDNGEIIYKRCDTEEELLKKFLEILKKINPTVIAGWNSEGYDYPYITLRILRVLDKETELFIKGKFNEEILNNGYVSQLSPVNLIKYKEKKTTYGIVHTFQWVGYILEDYRDLYKKYTYTSHTSDSLSSISTYELGSDKVNHDEFSDFADFYLNNFDLFIAYGVQDVSLLVDLDSKLKLIDLAKYLAYYCGVTMNDVRGTIKQWNSFMYNESFKEGYILPISNNFPSKDDVLLKYATSENYNGSRKNFYKDLLHPKVEYKKLTQNELQEVYNRCNGDKYTIQNEIDKLTNVTPDLIGQKFAGGWTRGTARFWKWVFSLDYTSLYPSAQMWANIGIDTLILPKDLPEELLQLRAEYFIYYPKNVESKELEQYDYEFIKNNIENEQNRNYINSVLKKYNVCATPNGMFFKKSHRSIMSTIIEKLIIERKVYKKLMKESQQKIENWEKEISNIEDEKIINELKLKIEKEKALEDKYNVYQMGIKIFLNSNYGSQSMNTNVFAGHSEYFSGAITSTSRIANIFISREQSKKVDILAGSEAKEIKYNNIQTYMDNIAQADTDSCYVSLENVIKKKFPNYIEMEETEEGLNRLIEFTLNYINKVAMPLVRDKLDNEYAFAMNAYLPEKLTEDPEVICDKFISIAPKMYFARKWWDEGVTLAKPKLKITGLSTIRSNTPKLYRGELKKSMEVLITGDLVTVKEYMKEVLNKTYDAEPEDISFNQGVSSLDYKWYSEEKKFKRWDGSKWLSAPVNSRASLVHNMYVEKNDISVKLIEPGDKIGFLYMKNPNILPTNSNAFGFIDKRVFSNGLKTYIDRETMFEKGFLSPIKLITDPLGWNLEIVDEIDEEEW